MRHVTVVVRHGRGVVASVVGMCDTLCVPGDGRMLFAKNSDRAVGEVQVVEAFGRRTGGRELATQYLTIPDPAGAVAVIGSRPTWLWGFEHGINEYRVAIGNERVWTARDAESAEPRLIGMDLVRLALERATTAGAALDVLVELLEAHGQGGIAEEASGESYFSSFLVADPSAAWIVETCGTSWAARPATGGGSISNRLSLTDDWARASADVAPGSSFQQFIDPAFPTGHADLRLAATGAATRSASADARTLVATMRHHGDHAWGAVGDPAGRSATALDPVATADMQLDGTGVSVCMHLRNWEATAASLVAELPADPDEPQRAWAALGSPCVSVYLPLFPDVTDPSTGAGTVPACLTDPGTWQRFDVLRRRVEAARDTTNSSMSNDLSSIDPSPDDLGAGTLAAIRDVLGPLEDALWDEADELVADRADHERVRSFADAVGPRLTAALDRLDT